MPARTRRVRYLILTVFLVAVYLLYQRNPERVERYADYLEGAVGGGAVLRSSQTKSGDQNVPAGETTYQAAAVVGTTSGLADEFALPMRTTSREYALDVAPTTSSQAALAQSTSQSAARPNDNLDPQYPVKEPSDDDYFDDSSPDEPTAVHWKKKPEKFAISSTIPIPTGSARPIPRIQAPARGGADVERLAKIKEAARHAWDGYREIAWGYDELQPSSGQPKNTFNGWGATLVDSLDTLWIMGMKEEFEEAVQQVAKIDFTTSPREDIPLFEVTIRYLGGMIAGYDISGHRYQILLDKAVELAEILYSAFDTPNRMPKTFYHWKPDAYDSSDRAGHRIVMAELGTLSVEFTRLTQLTGKAKYYDAIARITDEFEIWQNNTRIPGMWPLIVDATGCKRPAAVAAGNSQNLQVPVPGGHGAMMTSSDPVKAGEIAVNTLSTSGVTKPVADAAKAGEKAANVAAGESATKMDTVPAQVGETKANTAPDGVDGITGAKPTPDEELDTETKMRLIPLAKDPKDPTSNLYKRQLDEPANPAVKAAPDSKPSTSESRAASSGGNADSKACLPQGFASSSLNAPETFGLGGASDSTYEYLPKEWLLLGGRVDQYKDMYLASMKPVVDQLLFRPMTPDNLDILISGELHASVDFLTGQIKTRLEPKQEHLTCFVGGMFGMGGKIFEIPEHVELGRKLTEGCIWSYNSTASGIMPEIFLASKCSSTKTCTWNETKYWEELDPYASTRISWQDTGDDPREQLANLANLAVAQHEAEKVAVKQDTRPQQGATSDKVSKDQAGTGHLNKRDAPVGGTFADLDQSQAQQVKPAAPPSQTSSTAAGAALNDMAGSATQVADGSRYTPPPPLSHEEFVKKRIRDERLPPGFTRIDGKRYQLRPEAIESVFYMYRITGEQYWRDAGWEMFTAIDRATRTKYGHSTIDDITKAEPEARDAMESFWIAETLKYFYLLYDEPDNWSLDDWVLNTEAHFFRRPESAGTNAAMVA